MHNSTRTIGAAVAVALAVSACGGGGSSSSTPSVRQTAAPTTAPVPTPTGSGVSGGGSGAFTCPSSATSLNVVSAAVTQEPRRAVARPPRDVAETSGLLAVTYDLSIARRAATAIASREQSTGVTVVQELDFPKTNRRIHIVAVPAAQAASAAAKLRTQAGVIDVSPVGRRHLSTVSQPYFANDPYFDGFTAAQNASAGNAAPSTFEAGPYEENATVPGQWDMHAIQLEHAFGYSQANNGSGIVNASALGSSSIKLAIIDTGVDPNHPELSSKIAYQKCFITNSSGTQSTGNFTTDPFGHGSDVAGIAAEATNNGLGFSAAGGNVSLYAYRVFPTPDGNCNSDTTTDPRCTAGTTDIAAAISDAISHGANVISMSFGGGTCGTGGVDPDAVERQAIAEAVANNVVVVAAAGNSGSTPVDAPACDSGVIAAGASALADGQRNGTNSNGSASAPIEYVGSYSNYGTPAAQPKNPAAWGIVAPGGDPGPGTDHDNLHWIENIWTSTPFDASFAGNCHDDYPNSTGTTPPVDCRILVAGTSMSTPHIAGAAALILSVKSSYQSPSAMKTLLCQTADDIGDPHEGCGRLNVYRAMAIALSDPNPP